MRIEKGSSKAARLPGGAANPQYYRAYYAEHGDRIRARNRERWKNKPKHWRRQIQNLDYRKMVISLILERDGKLCGLCGLELVDQIEIDHIVQRAMGGTHEAGNLRLAHPECNRRRPKKGKGKRGMDL